MHPSAIQRMTECLETYLSKDKHYDLLDFGSFANKSHLNHRTILEDFDCTITGVDLRAGKNVDIVMTKPYRIPLRSGSQDVVLSGQTFEHIPFPWASILEIARVLKTGGYFFMTAPSRGHQHWEYDPWRYYPDSMRCFAAFAELELVDAYTDWPPLTANRRLDYAGIDTTDHYWGDTVGVFRKPKWRFSPWRSISRELTVFRANQIGDLSSVPRPKPRRRAPAAKAG